jgi:hypothetical protein
MGLPTGNTRVYSKVICVALMGTGAHAGKTTLGRAWLSWVIYGREY